MTEIINQKQENNQTFPVYIDQFGKFYDKHYNLSYSSIKDYSLEEQEQEQEQEQEKEKENENENENKKQQAKKVPPIEKYRPKVSQDIPEFPDVKNYKKYASFEKAVFEWKTQIEGCLGYLKLPNIVGRTYFRPIVQQDEFKNTNLLESENKNLIKHDRNRRSTTMPKSSSQMRKEDPNEDFEKMKGFDGFNNEKNTQTTSESTFEIMEGTNYYISSQLNLWDQQLIPDEPDAFNYDSIEEYEQAYCNWIEIVKKGLKIIPAHAKEFNKIYNIPTMVEKKIKERKRIEKKQALLFREEIEKKKKSKTEDISNNYFRHRKNLSLLIRQNSGTSNKISNPIYSQTLNQNNTKKKDKKKYKNTKEGTLKTNGTGINLAKEQGTNIGKEKEREQEKEFENVTKENFNVDIIHKLVTAEEENQWDNLKQESRLNILSCLRKIKNLKKNNKLKYNLDYPPIRGKVHGTFPENQQNTPSLKKKNKQGSSNRVTITLSSSLSNFCYQELLPQDEVVKTQDSPSEINGKKVLFNVPTYDLNNKINLRKLYNNDEDYIKLISNKIEKLQSNQHLKKLNYYYWPNKISDKQCTNDHQKFVNLFNKNNKPTAETVKQIFLSKLPLDKFIDFLSEEVIFGMDSTLYLPVMINFLDENNFLAILKLFSHSSSKLVHSKISHFICESLNNNFFQRLLEIYTANENIENLYYLTYAINFNQELPNEIFPFIPTLMKNKEISDLSLGKIEKNIFQHYYISIILKFITNQSFGSYKNVIAQCKDLISGFNNSISIDCQTNSIILEKQIFAGITTNHTTRSTYYLMIFLYLLQLDNEIVQNILKTSEINLFEKIIEMSKSKKTHVRFAAETIWEKLISQNVWIDHFVQFYSQNTELLVKNLQPPVQRKGIEGSIALLTRPTLANTLICRLLIHYFQTISNHQSKSLFKKTLFDQIFGIIEKDLNVVSSNITLIQYSEVLLTLIQTFNRLNLITKTENISMQISILSYALKSTFGVTYSEITKILNLIKNTPSRLYPMKSNFLKILIMLLKTEQVFALIHENTDFFSTLNILGRQSTDYEFSKQLWNLFFQSIFYHADTLNKIKKRYLKNMIELIGPISHNTVIAFGLHTLCRLFDMDRIENERLKLKKPPARVTLTTTNLKSFDQDIKTFVKFFISNHFFVKLNMFYMQNREQKGGIIFLNLVKVYERIINSPNCTKILNAMLKKKAYKEGIKEMASMLTDKIKITEKLRKNTLRHLSKSQINLIQIPSSPNNKNLKRRSVFFKY
ncbi:sca1 complex scaffold protein scaa [Anaeramoeba flamelloides]|uniref:Sca1 complex scaffold protein scaa n=1 Tax=Anaeramoeba flamelloides TaxID=1746091 RepID=A0ABQ8XI86_9EUKA|nr:sca1 complex scaffold protein scaa [Anaeramoeba flamelloides]